jgi:hypothetical protein
MDEQGSAGGRVRVIVARGGVAGLEVALGLHELGGPYLDSSERSRART